MAKYDSGYFKDFNFNSIMRSAKVDETLLQTVVCRNLYTWWKSFHPKLPSRKDFDILDHLKAAPHIFMIEVLPNHEFLYRTQGEEVINLIGMNNMGKVFSRTCGDKSMENFAIFLHEVIDHRKAIHSYGTMEAMGRAFLHFEAFDLPLINEEGEVTHILGAIASSGKYDEKY
ncbi:PAS domain-containing protein [Curvivirga sp.]|uniref:PAS domain-containing protein n=1 Tax=Curvivirga sp. TaxID=2856848 RepID=UPI003B5B09E1